MKTFKAFFVYILYRLLYASWRYQIVEHPGAASAISQRRPLIMAHWHGDELALLPLVRRYQLCTMTSTSRDGELINYVILRLGGTTTRGSSTRGGVGGLKGLIRALRAGHRTSLAVDGPKGPIYQPKPGVYELSKLGHAFIAPVGASATHSFVFQKSWNKAFLPWPFARVVAFVGDPLPPIKSDQEIRSASTSQELISAINAARHEAAKLIATSNREC